MFNLPLTHFSTVLRVPKTRDSATRSDFCFSKNLKNTEFLFHFLGAKTIGAVQRGLTVSHAGIAKSPMVALRKTNVNLPEEVESARSIELNIGKKVNKQLTLNRSML